MNFEQTLISAKEHSKDATETIVIKYRPLLIKSALMKDGFDEDLYQELQTVLLNVIQAFEI